MPEHILGLRPVYQHHFDTVTERERTPDVQNKYGIGMISAIKTQGRICNDSGGGAGAIRVPARSKSQPGVEVDRFCWVVPVGIGGVVRGLPVSKQKVVSCSRICIADVRSTDVVFWAIKLVRVRTNVTTKRCHSGGRKFPRSQRTKRRRRTEVDRCLMGGPVVTLHSCRASTNQTERAGHRRSGQERGSPQPAPMTRHPCRTLVAARFVMVVLLIIRHIPLQNLVQNGPCVPHNKIKIEPLSQGDLKVGSRRVQGRRKAI